jgi:hypothetical protein
MLLVRGWEISVIYWAKRSREWEKKRGSVWCHDIGMGNGMMAGTQFVLVFGF